MSVDVIIELGNVQALHADRRDAQFGQTLEDRVVVDFLPRDVQICQVRGVQLEGPMISSQ